MNKLLLYIYIYFIFFILITPILYYNIKNYNTTNIKKKRTLVFLDYTHKLFGVIMFITPFITNNILLLYINLFLWIFIVVGWFILKKCWLQEVINENKNKFDNVFKNEFKNKNKKSNRKKNNMLNTKLLWTLIIVIPIYICTYKLNIMLIGTILNILYIYYIFIIYDWNNYKNDLTNFDI